MLEIELKARLDPDQALDLEARLPALGLVFDHWSRESDDYFQAPDRDFLRSDEALRLRTLENEGGSQAFLTYKGPKLDPLSNTRQEIETAIGHAPDLEAILTALGYRSILTVKKSRKLFKGREALDGVSLCLDQVEGLGSFLELEYLLADDLDPEKRESIRNRLLSLLDDLAVSRERLTRKSYLELLIASMTS